MVERSAKCSRLGKGDTLDESSGWDIRMHLASGMGTSTKYNYQVHKELTCVIRRLPRGTEYAGSFESDDTSLLQVSVLATNVADEFKVGTLVELRSEQTLYLGEIVGRQGATMIVEVEHALELAVLEAVQEAWQSSPEQADRDQKAHELP